MKHKKILKFLIYSIIMLFLFSYVVEKSGYYEYNLQKQKVLTEDSMKRFERDIEKGENVDINNYLEDNKIDYSNKLTDTVSSVNISINKYLKKTISNTFEILGKLIN